MYISNVKNIFGQDGSIRKLLIELSFDDELSEKPLKEILSNLAIYNRTVIKDIANKTIYEPNSMLNFTILETIENLTEKNIVPIEILLHHKSTIIQTFDGLIGATQTSEINLYAKLIDKKQEISLKVSPKDTILIESNIETLREKCLQLSQEIKDAHAHLSLLKIPEETTILKRLKHIDGKSNT